jgi:hypothetical protein
MRLRSLLSDGYFPAELPPPFNTKDFGRYRKYLKDKWPNQNPPRTSPEHYNIPRIGRKRRNLSIVNPISQFFLSDTISDGWVEIEKFLDLSKISLDVPRINEAGIRAISKPDFSGIELQRLQAGGEYDHILLSDISRFYGTIYTHTLPWAMHGKSWCKANLNTPALKATLGDKLDVLVRKGQDNQTMGIPIGPDTSRILSEIIAVAVDRHFFDLNNADWNGAFRFVDDWFIGHDNASEAETAVRHLAQACAEYELELNLEKTKVLNAADPIIESWPNELLDLMVSATAVRTQTNQLKRFFSRAFQLASEHPQSNVMDYALKLARSFRIGMTSYPLFESFVLRSARAYPITLPTVTQILINYRKDHAPISMNRCRKLVLDILRVCVPLRHTEEVAWALFLSKGLNMSLPSEALLELSKTDNSVWALLALDLESLGLIDGNLDKTEWQSQLTSNDLNGPSWLLAYEADIKGWLTPTIPNHVDADMWFSVMKNKGISFYDTTKNVPTFKKSRLALIQKSKKRQSLAASFFQVQFATYLRD